tara:strand:+ start:1281 stop:1709 length:429 start_codon:yes stop_codon:yes gene_type:complete
MPADSWKLAPGLHNVGSYQVSGRPFASGSINAKLGSRLGGHEIVFPYVTRWFEVINKDASNNCKVAFSVTGMTGSNNYFTVAKADVDANGAVGRSGILELKVSSIWVSGSTDVDVVAGLTGVPAYQTNTDSGASWSGSSGVG